MALNLSASPVLDANALLGEGPCWDVARQLVWMVDIKRHRLWQYDSVSGDHKYYQAPAQIGWALPSSEGPLLCGLQDGLHTFDPVTGAFTFLAEVPGEPAGNRLNDACTDPWGRAWFGSMDDGEEQASGRFYVFDRGEVRPAGPDGITITNGPAVNAAGDRIYFTDTLRRKIMVADLTAEGVGPVRSFVDTAVHFPDAYPDGTTVDSEGYLWSAFYLGGCAARFTPDGELALTIPLPARDVTKIAFGGSDLMIAFATTATKDLADADRADWPGAGSLLAFRSPVAGFVQTPVKLT